MAIYTQEQLTSLTKAISQGATTVKYGDKEVTYRSLTEMLQLQELMKTDLGLNGANPSTRGRTYAQHSKGLC
jgi:hypothetical protein